MSYLINNIVINNNYKVRFDIYLSIKVIKVVIETIIIDSNFAYRVTRFELNSTDDDQEYTLIKSYLNLLYIFDTTSIKLFNDINVTKINLKVYKYVYCKYLKKVQIKVTFNVSNLLINIRSLFIFFRNTTKKLNFTYKDYIKSIY